MSELLDSGDCRAVATQPRQPYYSNNLSKRTAIFEFKKRRELCRKCCYYLYVPPLPSQWYLSLQIGENYYYDNYDEIMHDYASDATTASQDRAEMLWMWYKMAQYAYLYRQWSISVSVWRGANVSFCFFLSGWLAYVGQSEGVCINNFTFCPKKKKKKKKTA